MWLFTEEGFFSAVAGRDNEDQIVVRARDRDDLVRLLDTYWAASYYRPEILDEGGDYPHRVVMGRDEWAEIVQEAAQKIDYTNFKDMVHDTLGPDRAHTYLRVWSALLELEAKQCSECENTLLAHETVLCTPCVRFHVARAEAAEIAKLQKAATKKALKKLRRKA